MANEATRDAKLSLKFETRDAVKGLQDVERAGAKVADTMKGVERQAASAMKTMERYGADELSRPMPMSRRDQQALSRWNNKQAILTAEAAWHEEQARGAAWASQMGNRARALSGSGAGMGMLGKLGAAGAAIGGIAGAAAFISDTTLQRNDLTDAQKFNHVLNTVTGGLWKLQYALDGTVEGMRRAGLRLEEQRAAVGARARNISELNALAAQSQGATARAGVYGGASVSGMPSFDRWTMAGQRAYEEFQTLLPAQDAAAEARREAEAARQSASLAGGRHQESVAAYEAARGRRRLYQRRDRAIVGQENFTFDRQQLARQQNLGDLQVAADEERSAFEEMVRRRQELARAGVSAAEAESRARQANIQVMQAELQVLQQREQRMVSDASRLGGQTVVDRRLGLMAARQIERLGIENVTPEVRARVQAFAPEYFQQRATQFGETTGEYAAGRREGFLTPGTGTIEGTRDEMARLQQQIREETLENQRSLYRTIGDTFERSLRDIASVLEERVQQIIRDIRNGRNLQNNAAFG